MEEIVGGPEQTLCRRHIKVQKARQRQIDRLDFGEVDAIIEAAQFIEIFLRQRHRRIGTKGGPFLTRETSEWGNFLDEFFHGQSFGREAFSAMPLMPWRRASTSITSESLTLAASSRTRR